MGKGGGEGKFSMNPFTREQLQTKSLKLSLDRATFFLILGGALCKTMSHRTLHTGEMSMARLS